MLFYSQEKKCLLGLKEWRRRKRSWAAHMEFASRRQPDLNFLGGLENVWFHRLYGGGLTRRYSKVTDLSVVFEARQTFKSFLCHF